MYEVLIHAKAEKEYRKLPERVKRAFANAMLILQTNPYPFQEYDLKKLRGSENIFRIRVGGYRLIYSVEKDLKKIAVLKMEHREERCISSAVCKTFALRQILPLAVCCIPNSVDSPRARGLFHNSIKQKIPQRIAAIVALAAQVEEISLYVHVLAPAFEQFCSGILRIAANALLLVSYCFAPESFIILSRRYEKPLFGLGIYVEGVHRLARLYLDPYEVVK